MVTYTFRGNYSSVENILEGTCSSQTESIDFDVTLHICIRKVRGSILRRDIHYYKVLCGFTHFLHENSTTVPQTGHNYFLPNPFQFMSSIPSYEGTR
jgi:hypothetical protein